MIKYSRLLAAYIVMMFIMSILFVFKAIPITCNLRKRFGNWITIDDALLYDSLPKKKADIFDVIGGVATLLFSAFVLFYSYNFFESKNVF